MKNLLTKLGNHFKNKKNRYPLILLLISLYLIIINHVPGTFLSGWDTLHPEFNFGLNFQRLIFGVFRDNQGLGAVAAHAHMSDLPRVIFIFLLSIFLPQNLLRFFYIGLCLPIGTLGTYYFIRNVIFAKTEHSFKEAGSFLGALFYLLNLGTLQHFYVPFEMFNTQFAFLPWLFLTVVNYLNNPTKKNLFFFGLVNLFSTPMAYAATLWFAYFAGLILFLIPFFKHNVKKIIVIIFLTLAINSFWLLPNIYFLTSGNAANVPNAKINELFSEEAFAYNKSFGNIKDTLIFKNFLFEWKAYRNNKFAFLMENWRTHLNQPNILLIGYVLAGTYLTGLIYGVSKKNRYLIALIFPSLFAFIFLINENPPFSSIFFFLRSHSNTFKEALRFPFTKFSLLLIFACSCYFAFGLDLIYRIYAKLHSKIATLSIISAVTFLLIIYMLPAFKGDLISPLIQIKIPNEYQQAFSWFNLKPDDGRVALLPVHSFWGWIYYNWGFQGSGLLSYGIKQPLLDRDFDRWNPSNEENYRELSYALYSRNLSLLEDVLDKYQIKYLFFDNNVIPAGESVGKEILFSNEIKSLFEQSSKIHLAKEFGNIQVYEFESDKSFQKYLYTPSSFAKIQGSSGFKDLDFEYQSFGDYITSTSNSKLIKNYFFPFNSFIDNQNFLNAKLISYENNKLILKTQNLPYSANLPISDYLDKQTYIPSKIILKQTTQGLNVQLQLILPQSSNEQTQPSNTINFDLVTKGLTNLVINLDNQQTINLGNIQNLNSLNEGQFLLSTKAANDFTFYNEFKNIPLDISKLNQNLELCDLPNFNQLYNSKLLDDKTGFVLSSKKAQVCLKTPLKNIIEEKDIDLLKSLINIKFQVDSQDKLLGHYCVFDNVLSRCIKEIKDIDRNSQVNDFFPIDKYQINNYSLIFYAENPKEQIKSITYKNIEINIANPLASYAIKPDDLIKLVAGNNLNIDKNSQIIIDSSSSTQRVDITPEREPQTCSDIKPDSYSRRVDESGVLVYSSINGSSCDHFSLPNLSHNNSYLLSIRNQNIEGLPLRICISNYLTKRCDIYTDLPSNPSFAYSNLVIPPSNDGGFGYDINLDNISIGKQITTNEIADILVLNFPYDWITQMVFTDNQTYPTSTLAISNILTLNPNFITLNYNNNSNFPSLLTLNIAYEKGWIVLNKKHTLVNSWANGWIVDPKDQGKIYIVFVPEILELFGFVLTLGTFLILLLPKKLKTLS